MVQIIRRVTNRALSFVNRGILPYVEMSLAEKGRDDTYGKPVFVLGPPRSGSTLIMQVLTDAFDFSYLSNAHCTWFGAPALAERILQPLAEKVPSNYLSKHGRTNGRDAPAECGAWWYRFFPRERPYATIKDVSNSKMTRFVDSLDRFERAAGRPLIFKNLYASLRIDPIAYYVPNSLFVVVERDWVDNGASILKGRYDALGDYNRWWSVPPPNLDELSDLSPVKQVVEQVSCIYHLIEHDIARLGLEEQTFRIRYEDFCDNVHGTLEAFHDFAHKNGLDLGYRYNVPEQFSINHEPKIPDAMYEELKTAVACSQDEKNAENGAGE